MARGQAKEKQVGRKTQQTSLTEEEKKTTIRIRQNRPKRQWCSNSSGILISERSWENQIGAGFEKSYCSRVKTGNPPTKNRGKNIKTERDNKISGDLPGVSGKFRRFVVE